MNDDNDSEINKNNTIDSSINSSPSTNSEAETSPESPTEPVTSTTEEETKPSEPSTPPVAISGGSNDSKKSKILLTLLILVLVGALGYAAYMVTSQKTVVVVPAHSTKKSVALIKVGAIDGSANSFYPSADDSSSTAYQINAQVYEGLVQFQNVSKIVPLLATSWTNPDDSTWVFNLKSGVKFHDGKTMTADDVKYSLEKYQADALGGVFKFDAKEITVVSQNKVKIVTNGADPLLLHKLAYLGIVDSKADKPTDPSSATGPYTVKSGTTPSATDLDLTAFSDYHGGKPLTKELQWKVYSTEDDLVKDAEQGKVDYTTGIDTVGNLDQIKQKASLTTSSDTGIGVSSLGVNVLSKTSPLAKLKFRQAIAAAIDRDMVIKDANLKADPAEQVVTKDVPGYNSSIKLTKPDIAKAKQLLTEAGYPNGASFTISYSKDTAQDQIDSITKQLKAINVTVKQDGYTDFDALVSKAFETGSDSYFLSYTTDLLDSSDVLSTLFVKPNYDSTELNTLLDQAGKTVDPAKRLTELQSASKLVIDDVGEVPIYSLTFNTTYNPKLMIKRDTSNATYFWQVYQKG
jgi:peptide/nickel transport system substrate-binding protein